MSSIHALFYLAATWSLTAPLLLSAAEPLFRGDFEQATTTGNAALTGPTTIAEYTQHSTCNKSEQVRIVSNPVRQGRFAARFWLNDELPSRLASDITRDKERCVISMKPFNTAGGIGEYDGTRWYAWSIYLPKEREFSADDSYAAVTHWMNHAQLMYNDANSVGKACFHLVPGETRWQAQVRGGPINNYETKVFKFGSLERGVWHDFLMEFHYHGEDGKALTRIQYRAGGGSFVEVVNDKRANVPLTTLPTTQHRYSFDVGIYRDGRQNGDQVIYVDGPWVGRTAADVMPFFSVDTSRGAIPAPSGLQLDIAAGD